MKSQTKLEFSVHTPVKWSYFCTPLPLQTFIWPRLSTRPRERSRWLVISLPGQWSLSSPISRKGPAQASGEASPSWRYALRWRTPPPISSRGRRPQEGGGPRLRLLFSPFNSSTLTQQPHSVLPSSSRTASAASRGSSNSTKAKPGGLLATHTLRSGP